LRATGKRRPGQTSLGDAGGEVMDRKFVTALARGLDILRAFTPSDSLLGNQEIAQRTGLPKPTVSRLTYTLTQLGYLEHAERMSKYRLSTGVLALGYSVLSGLGIRRIARPFMEELAEYANASVSLGSRHRLDMVYIETVRPSRALAVPLDLGAWIPIATTAMGRAQLAAMPETERRRLLNSLAQENPKTWPRLRVGVEQAIAHYKAHGFTLSLGEWQSSVNAVGAPIKLPDGNILAFNCGAPAFLCNRAKLVDDLGPRLVNLVRNVEAALMRG
jgi:DNA-binding IclR family transcriptional regulator